MYDALEAENDDVGSDSVNAATFDAMLRRLQLGDPGDAARILDAPENLVVDWRSGKVAVPTVIADRMYNLAAMHMEVANTLTDTILKDGVPNSEGVILERFVDEAQYNDVGPLRMSIDGCGMEAIPYQIHLAAALTAADVLTAAGLDVAFHYLDAAAAERMKASRYSGISLEQAQTTH